MLTKQRLTRCEIRCGEEIKSELTVGRFWFYREQRMGKWTVISTGGRETKAAFIKYVISSLHRRVADGEFGFSLRIYKKNGEVQQERTYPRSADPRKTKG